LSPGPYIGVEVAIIKNEGVLLTRREDFNVWCLPGGAVASGETLAQAAVREAGEETGLEVELSQLVGIYSSPNWHRGGSHIATFAGRLKGGGLKVQPGEVLEAAYFAADSIPEALLAGERQRIEDALAGIGGGITGFIPGRWPFPPEIDRQSLYKMRDHSGLTRQEFYRQHFGLQMQADFVQETPLNGSLAEAIDRDTGGWQGAPGGSGGDQPLLGASVVVIQDGKALLTRREDFDVWCLPGGEVDQGESVAQAAMREIAEETGLRIELDRLVGIYSEPDWFSRGLHVVMFSGHPMGGALRPQPGEVVELNFFDFDGLPIDFLAGHRVRLEHALHGVGGSVARSQYAKWPFPAEISRLELYDLRDASGMTRREFYMQYFYPREAEDSSKEDS
jgi:ADP-ribose pyrophosphatase YjhB (NUDIX family)